MNNMIIFASEQIQHDNDSISEYPTYYYYSAN